MLFRSKKKKNKTKEMEKNKWILGGEYVKRRTAYRKTKSKSSRRLIGRIKVSSDGPLVFVRA